jgi:hypothetical protein
MASIIERSSNTFRHEDSKLLFEKLMAAYGLHDSWLQEYIKANGGKCPPRIKKVRKEFAGMPGVFLGEDGNYYIDIAVPFDKLTPDWQEANTNMATFVLNMLDKNANLPHEEYFHEIHEFWLTQNEWARGGPLGVPYNELPEEEKAKDRLVFEICFKFFKKI